MKNVKFLSGLLIGIILGVCIMALIKCKSDSSVQEQQVSNSITMLEDIETLGGPDTNLDQPNVYKLMVDNIQYIVVSKPNAVAIVRHK
ncbi:MAG: hypothetical protein EPN88_17115 [Bacteroidetes bacterium]|nr:MAG: hypothetical protein EPN88_17115 [Bacteroidota bacterium]